MLLFRGGLCNFVETRYIVSTRVTRNASLFLSCEKSHAMRNVDFVTSLSMNFNEVWMQCCYLICRIEHRV